jgi:hypothetical protein
MEVIPSRADLEALGYAEGAGYISLTRGWVLLGVGQPSNDNMFLHGLTDDIGPVVAKHLCCFLCWKNLSVDDGTEIVGGFYVSEEGDGFWMAKQYVCGSLGAGTGDVDSVATESTERVGNESGDCIGRNVRLWVVGSGAITGYIHEVEHIVG